MSLSLPVRALARVFVPGCALRSLRRSMAGVAACLALLLLGIVSAHAQTPVSGAIEADARWTVAGSPYVVSGELVIRNNAVLTIDAGVSVQMDAAAGLRVQQGAIRAAGSASQPIRVLSAKAARGQTPARGDYGPWLFGPGTSASTQLDHVEFRHGSGLVVQGSAPVFNHLDIRQQQGAAISIDLAASPRGVGNRASENGLNGIAVPAGDIAGRVQWGLVGIPYIVQSGTVSVGQSPAVTAVTPSTIEQGQTVSVTVDGVRLDGFSAVSTSQSGITLTPFSGGTGTRIGLQMKAAADAQPGAGALRFQVDAGEVVVPNAFTVTPPLPAISAVAPDAIVAGSGVTALTVTGRNFSAQSELLVNAASIPTQFVSATQLTASLPNQPGAATLSLQVLTPVAGGNDLRSNSVELPVRMPVPPTLSFEPTPIAMPPDNKPHNIVLRLSKADIRDHTINVSISDTTKARVSPASLVIAAGQTTALIAITPLVEGSVTLRASSATLGESAVPVFMTQNYQGLNTSYARPVGVFVEGEPSYEAPREMKPNSMVGVGVGAVLADVAPRGWVAGVSQRVQVSGVAIPAGSQVALVPSTGVSLAGFEVAADGRTLSFDAIAAGDAPRGPRRLEVRDANGTLLTFADAERATIVLNAAAPVVESITPLQVMRGTTNTVVVRGRNLHDARLRLEPGVGFQVDAQPVINADGTELVAKIHVASDAPLGSNVVIARTVSGTSAATAGSGNTLHVVSAIAATYSWTAPIVGVVVGDAVPAPDPQQMTPILTQHLGVVVGASATDVAPRVGIVGSTVRVTVRGQGLRDVTDVSLVPAAGVVVGERSATTDGSELSFDLQIAADTALGLRRLVLTTDAGPMAFADIADSAFLVSAPVPEVQSVTPPVLTPGGAAQTLIVRGQYLENVTDVRFEPSAGITVSRPFTVSDGGTALSFAALVGANAATGPRTLIVTTAAGTSSDERAPANTVTLASQIGATYPDIVAPVVGVRVGDAAVREFEGLWMAPLVGVVVTEDAPAPVEIETTPTSELVGLVVGSVARGKSGDGWLQGATDTLRIDGVALDEVVAIEAAPADGVLFGAPRTSEQGRVLETDISIAGNAPLGSRRIRLKTSSGEVSWLDANNAAFGIGKVPTLDSMTPIVLARGETVALRIRGRDLAGVTRATFVPAGIAMVEPPVWTQDELGELLTVQVQVDPSAPTGQRVMQLHVPGGATSATPSAANTLNVVPPP